MADQQRWFKFWCSAPADDALQALAVRDRWAWVVLGAYTKVHGTHGAVRVTAGNPVLSAEMGVAPGQLLDTIARLPHIYLSSTPIRWPHGHDKPMVCAGEVMRGGHPLDSRGRDTLKEWGSHYGGLIVTWRNWYKYQEDTTAGARGYALRSKKRREEKREEVDSKPKGYVALSPPAENGHQTPTTAENRAFVEDLRARLAKRMTP